MKKKGLIIATIVMVLVLAVSLTTATYAWFTASNVTKISEFSVSVVSNNAVNIGVKDDCSAFAVKSGDTPISTSLFCTGDVAYTKPSSGLVGGTWNSETDGLSANINHDIVWGQTSTAIAARISGDALSTSQSDYYNLGYALKGKKTDNTTNITAAEINKANAGATTGTLVNVANANCNYAGAVDDKSAGDYAYLFLGASPNVSSTETLDTNNLVVMLDWSTSNASTLGIIASIHIAYRFSKDGAAASAWTDVDILGAGGYSGTTSKNGVTSNVVNGTTGQAAYGTAYTQTYTGTAPANNSYAFILTGLSTGYGAVDQIEMIIYMDGTDPDCSNAGLNAGCTVKIFFCTDVVA